jgi:hypothetical protein
MMGSFKRVILDGKEVTSEKKDSTKHSKMSCFSIDKKL